MKNAELYVKNVADLRCMGRAMGVKSPTTMSKQELIQSIWQIYCGELEPYYTNMGRPPLNKEKSVPVFTKDDLDKVEAMLLRAVAEIVEKLKEKFDI